MEYMFSKILVKYFGVLLLIVLYISTSNCLDLLISRLSHISSSCNSDDCLL